MIEKVYLGDGAYADFDGFNIVLTTSDGIKVTNTIYLEPEVVKSLKSYILRTEELRAEAVKRVGVAIGGLHPPRPGAKLAG
jgi:hypothetical protein